MDEEERTIVRQCPVGHPLRLRTDLVGPWRCHGAVVPYECLSGTSRFKVGKTTPRFRCAENCNFDLCDVCLNGFGDEVDEPVEELILYVRRVSLRYKQPTPPFSIDNYRDAVYFSGRDTMRGRYHWLIDEHFPRVEFKLGDTFDETLLFELMRPDSNRGGFTKNAYKRALFFSGNKSAELALEWLRDEKNSSHPFLDFPISDKVGKCPNGHRLVPSDEYETKNNDNDIKNDINIDKHEMTERWICDKEDSFKECKMTTENYTKANPRIVKRYICEKNCSYNLCDLCLLAPDSCHRKAPLSQENIASDSKEKESDEEDDDDNQSTEYTYQFVNLNRFVNQIRQFVNLNKCYTDVLKWTNKIKAETLNAEVVSHHLFKSPLRTLPFGKAVMNLKFPGEDHHLHHKYIVLGLQDKTGKKTFLSAEKDRTGISVQLHDDYDRVTNYHLDKPRIDPEEIDSKDLTSINHLEYIHLPEIGKLLEKWEIMPLYELRRSNCQTLTRYIGEQMLKASNAVHLNLPGTNKKASINSPELLPYIKNRFPNWEKKKLVTIPELQVQFAMKIGRDGSQLPAFATSDEVEDAAKEKQEISLKGEYDELVLKQNGFEGIRKALSGEAFSNDKKAIFFNLTRDRIEKRLTDEKLRSEVPAESWKGIPESISDYWKSSFEFMSITSGHGIFIFQYASLGKAEGTVTDEEMKDRAKILQELGQFDMDKCITTVSIQINPDQVKPEISDPKEMEYGYHFHLKVSQKHVTHDLKFCLKSLAQKVKSKIQNGKWKKKMGNLVAKITVLQNLENETHLIHQKIDNQEWGKSGVMLWSEAQRVCIEKGRKAFKGEEKPLRLIMRGCQGSGKTLVLVRLAKEFVLSNEGNVLIDINLQFERLKQDLRAIVLRDQLMKNRVFIGSFYHPLFLKQRGYPIEIKNEKDYLLREMEPDEDKSKAFLCIEIEKGKKLFYSEIDYSSIGAIFYDESELSIELLSVELYPHEAEIMRHLLPKQHLILATSKRHFTAEAANKACKSARLDFNFQEVILEGNFRSSPKISNLTEAYQESSSISGTANISVKTTMDFSSSRPKIIAQKYPDRNNFIERVIAEVRESLIEHKNTDIAVLTFCHLSLTEKMKTTLTKEERERVIFSNSRDALGCQFPVVILVVDASTICPSFRLITDILTRATTALTCVVNTSLNPLNIDGRVSFSTESRSPSDISAYFTTLAEKLPGVILVRDKHELVSDEIRNQLRETYGRFDFKRNLSGEENEGIRQRTKTAAVVVEVVPPFELSSLSTESHCPYIELVVKNENDRDCDRNYDKDYRAPINDFFIKAAPPNESSEMKDTHPPKKKLY